MTATTTTFTVADMVDTVDIFESYEGEAHLDHVSGTVVSGTIHIVQVHSAHIFGIFQETGGTLAGLAQRTPNEWTLHGTTLDGTSLESGPLTSLTAATVYRASAAANLFYVETKALHAILPHPDPSVRGTYRYTLTNFFFAWTATGYLRSRLSSSTVLETPVPERSFSTFVLRDPTSGISANVVIRPRAGWDDAILRLRTRGRARVTSDVFIASTATSGDPLAPNVADDIMERLVRVMSLGSGSRVQWITLTAPGPDGTTTERLHVSRLTGGFSQIPLIRLDHAGDVVAFLVEGFVGYTQRRQQYRLDRTSDAYIGAREHFRDFMEQRALRLAVALEALRAALSEHTKGQSEYVGDLTKAQMKPLRAVLETAIRNALTQAGAPPIRDDVANTNKITNLFRKDFREQIVGLIGEIGMYPVSGTELTNFVASRNALVHRGMFDVQAKRGRQLSPIDLMSAIDAEFWADFHMLDRIFMGILGYRGKFRDARDVTGQTLTKVAYR